jgi:hypothetical protein
MRSYFDKTNGWGDVVAAALLGSTELLQIRFRCGVRTVVRSLPGLDRDDRLPDLAIPIVFYGTKVETIYDDAPSPEPPGRSKNRFGTPTTETLNRWAGLPLLVVAREPLPICLTEFREFRGIPGRSPRLRNPIRRRLHARHAAPTEPVSAQVWHIHQFLKTSQDDCSSRRTEGAPKTASAT